MKKLKNWLVLALAPALLYSCGGSNSNKLVKDWKATEFTLGETKIVADSVVGIYFSFKPDSTFEYTETAQKDKGKWKMGPEGKTIILLYGDGRTVVQNVKELTDDKLVVEYEDFGMKRSITMVPKK
ncbi:MAG TPA: lipocalin family protein [Cytophagaceae bacterium]|jgi:hypothetical protein|nr:lipocalin family protein [Cytophagaceae bacterium]